MFSVKNWGEFQHYKDRNPPWIKLHNHLLDDYDFEYLSDSEKGHLLCIWMLASRTKNKMPFDSRWITKKIGASSKVNLDALVDAGFLVVEQDASKTLHKENQTATVSIPSEEKRRGEGEKSRVEDSGAKRFAPPSLENAIQYFGERAIAKNILINPNEPEKFIDFYESKNWMVGRNKMKDWKAAVRNWLNNVKPEKQNIIEQSAATNWHEEDLGL